MESSMYATGPRELQTTGMDADSFEDLAELAIANIGNQYDLAMVCGPISTGGTGHQVLNFEVFNACVRGLEARGKRLFNQIPYEYGLRKLYHKWEEAGNSGYCMPILTTFYARIFESGRITEGWFIPCWQSSFGSRWERDKLLHCSRNIYDITPSEVKEFLEASHDAEHVDMIMSLLAK
jgi:hypothetical protein